MIVQRACRSLLVFRGSGGGRLCSLWAYWNAPISVATVRDATYRAAKESPPRLVRWVRRNLRVPHELLSRGWVALPGAAGGGIALCLMADAGRPERVLSLWLAPRFTVVTVGAWALLASGCVGGFLRSCVEWRWRAIAALRGARRRRRRRDRGSGHGGLHGGAPHAAALGGRLRVVARAGALLPLVAVVRGGRGLRRRVSRRFPRAVRRSAAMLKPHGPRERSSQRLVALALFAAFLLD